MAVGAMLAVLALAPAARAAAVGVHPFETTAADGTLLRGDVYVPDTGAPVATVLNLSPYWNTAHSPQSYGPSDQQLSRRDAALAGAFGKLLDAGFAVALVNMRGSGKSDGCLPYGDPVEATDAAAVVQALAAQPWSNGSVGMYGGSYHGWSQYLAVAARPPALKAIAPFSGIIDLWSLVTRNGAPALGAVTSDAPLIEAETSLGSLAPAAFDRLGCGDSSLAHAAAFAQLVANGDRTEYWERRDLRRAIAGAPLPAFVANGLDFPLEGHLTQFDGLWGILAPQRTRLLLGQWEHDWPANHRPDYNDQLVAFFDEHLRGGPGRLPLGVVEYQDDAGDWHTASSWPPSRRTLTLRLSGTALAPADVAPQPAARAYASSPEDTGLRCGSHAVAFASPPLAEDLLIAGNFALDVTLSADQPAGNLVAVLLRGTGDGDCQSVATGAAEAGRGELNLRHWAQVGHSRDFPVGTRTRVQFDSLPLVSRIKRGERLFLALGGGSVELLPGAMPGVTVHTGPGLAGSLALPVAGSAPAAAPGLAGDGRCRDATPPRTVFRSIRTAGRRLRVRGRSTDRVCGVASVRVALAREQRGRCRFLTARGRLARARSCRRPVLLAVRGRQAWTFAPRRRLPAGRYRLQALATDAAGNRRRASTRFSVGRTLAALDAPAAGGSSGTVATRSMLARERLLGADGRALDGSGTSIAIIDTGVDSTHPSFRLPDGSTKVVRSLTTLCAGGDCPADAPANSDAIPPGGHGTHVAGIAVGNELTLTDGLRVGGAAPGARLVTIAASAALIDVERAFEWVLQHHAAPCGVDVPASACPPIRVLTNSWGADSPRILELQRALARAGVVVVWAQGNQGGDGSSSQSNPAGIDPTPGILSAAAYDDLGTGTRDGRIAPTSSRGDARDEATWPDLSAPGVSIVSSCRLYLWICTLVGDRRPRNGPGPNDIGTFAAMSGTSMAAPQIAGTVAQLFQARPTATPAEIEAALKATAHRFADGAPYSASGSSFDKGAGLVDVYAAALRLGARVAGAPSAAGRRLLRRHRRQALTLALSLRSGDTVTRTTRRIGPWRR